MKYITVKVKFETSFTYEVEDEDWDEDDPCHGMTDETEEQLIDDTMETLADRSNRYWEDAEYTVNEFIPESDNDG